MSVKDSKFLPLTWSDKEHLYLIHIKWSLFPPQGFQRMNVLSYFRQAGRQIDNNNKIILLLYLQHVWDTKDIVAQLRQHTKTGIFIASQATNSTCKSVFWRAWHNISRLAIENFFNDERKTKKFFKRLSKFMEFKVINGY